MLSTSALKVDRLKKSVPTNWTAADHQSSQSSFDFHAPGRQRPLRRSWMNAANVKNTEPTKKVALVQLSPVRARYPGHAPIPNRREPIANPIDSRRSRPRRFTSTVALSPPGP